MKHLTWRAKAAEKRGGSVRRSTGDQQHLKDTFISLPDEQNLPRGLMLRLLSFNGLLIVRTGSKGGTGSRRNWKNRRERRAARLIPRDLANFSSIPWSLPRKRYLCFFSRFRAREETKTKGCWFRRREGKGVVRGGGELVVIRIDSGWQSNVHGFPLCSWCRQQHFGSLVPLPFYPETTPCQTYARSWNATIFYKILYKIIRNNRRMVYRMISSRFLDVFGTKYPKSIYEGGES